MQLRWNMFLNYYYGCAIWKPYSIEKKKFNSIKKLNYTLYVARLFVGLEEAYPPAYQLMNWTRNIHVQNECRCSWIAALQVHQLTWRRCDLSEVLMLNHLMKLIMELDWHSIMLDVMYCWTVMVLCGYTWNYQQKLTPLNLANKFSKWKDSS